MSSPKDGTEGKDSALSPGGCKSPKSSTSEAPPCSATSKSPPCSPLVSKSPGEKQLKTPPQLGSGGNDSWSNSPEDNFPSPPSFPSPSTPSHSVSNQASILPSFSTDSPFASTSISMGLLSHHQSPSNFSLPVSTYPQTMPRYAPQC